MLYQSMEDDADIRDIVIQMHDLEFSLMPSPEEFQANYVLSRRFRARMRRLVRRMSRQEAPRHRVRFVVGWAAALLLVLCITHTPDVTEACVDVIEWFTDYVQFHFQEQGSPGAISEYGMGYVPEGYVLTDSFHSESAGCIQYTSGEQILTLIYNRSSAQNNIDIKDKELEKIVADGRIVYYFKSGTDSENSIVWQSEDGAVCFSLTGSLPREELLRIRENIFVKN